MTTTTKKPGEIAREIIGIDEDRKRLAEEDRRLKERRGELESTLIDQLMDMDATAMTVGGRNVHIRSTTFFRPREGVEKSTVASALEAIGMTEIVKTLDYDSRTLDSRLREMVEDAQNRRALLAEQGEDVEFTTDPIEDLPEQLRGLLVCSTKSEIRAPKR